MKSLEITLKLSSVDSILKKDKDAILDELLNVKFGENCASYPDQIDFVVRTAFWTLKTADNWESKHIIHAINGYTDYLNSQSNDLDKYFSTLHLFTNNKSFEHVITMLVDMDTGEFNVVTWLRSITTMLIKMVNGSTGNSCDDERKKKLYLNLSQAILIYVNVEAQRALEWKTDFAETRYFIAECMKCGCFVTDRDQQYIECFMFLDQFINGLAKTKDLAKSIKMTTQTLR